MKKTYYAPYVSYTFNVPVKDPETGKPMIRKNPTTGLIELFHGRPAVEKRAARFTTISANISKGLLCSFETEEPDEIAVLEKLVKDQATKVMDAEGYEKYRDPSVFAEKKKNKELEAKLEAQEKEIAEYKKAIEETNRKLKDAQQPRR